ncbi:hypothetical protein AUC43_15970 [Hymenobacter sedentarius]|uniref:Uncharacterized protein n=2 Tax=Hymenobacter sedentarius TaxID=1411621 RepID=A0A0U4C629_9BACT|nr:hypothetical protein AUC43_15970 [Hymenobacter sedentarius]
MALLVGLGFIAPSCSQQEIAEPKLQSATEEAAKADKTKTFYGPAVPLGQGVGRAWVMVDATGTPLSIGVDLSAKSVLNQGTTQVDYVFQLPKQVAVPPFDHIELGWNPQGHEPEHVYDVPHFDLHFYMIPSSVQATIPFLAPPAMDVALAPKYVAPAYILTPGLVPNMGAHLVDVLSAEFQPGGVFTKTFIYGSYKGNLIFLEPMFTLAYLSEQKTETTPIRQPSAFQRAGYYPTSYTISYDDSPKQYHISLDNLTYHRAN